MTDTRTISGVLLGRSSLVGASVLAVLLMAWPLVSTGLQGSSQTLMWVALLGIPVLISLATLALDDTLSNSVVLGLVAVLVALATAARVISLGVGGVELIFIVVILAGRVLGARLGFLVGVLAVGLSSLVFGGVGPWTAFQMFAVGWVAAGAGLLPSRRGSAKNSSGVEIALLAVYGAVSSYVFGLVMNLWFWPIAVGEGTSLSLVEGAGFWENVSRFFVYSAVTSTLTWDTVRAITTVIGLVIIGKPALAALRRAYVRPV